eukprot:scaffold8683_cov104-Isochrysis_galbana.AAC.2
MDAMPGAKRSGQGGGGGGKRQNYHPPTPGVSELGRGMRGVLLTCDTHLERQAIREGFALLDEYAGGEMAAPAEPAAACADGGGVATGANTAADALAAELAGLRRDGAADGSDVPDPAAGGRRRFSVAQTGCTGSIVIRFGLPTDDPLATSTRVMEAAVARFAARPPRRSARRWRRCLKRCAGAITSLRGGGGAATRWHEEPPQTQPQNRPPVVRKGPGSTARNRRRTATAGPALPPWRGKPFCLAAPRGLRNSKPINAPTPESATLPPPHGHPRSPNHTETDSHPPPPPQVHRHLLCPVAASAQLQRGQDGRHRRRGPGGGGRGTRGQGCAAESDGGGGGGGDQIGCGASGAAQDGGEDGNGMGRAYGGAGGRSGLERGGNRAELALGRGTEIERSSPWGEGRK